MPAFHCFSGGRVSEAFLPRYAPFQVATLTPMEDFYVLLFVFFPRLFPWYSHRKLFRQGLAEVIPALFP